MTTKPAKHKLGKVHIFSMLGEMAAKILYGSELSAFFSRELTTLSFAEASCFLDFTLSAWLQMMMTCNLDSVEEYWFWMKVSQKSRVCLNSSSLSRRSTTTMKTAAVLPVTAFLRNELCPA